MLTEAEAESIFLGKWGTCQHILVHKWIWLLERGLPILTHLLTKQVLQIISKGVLPPWIRPREVPKEELLHNKVFGKFNCNICSLYFSWRNICNEKYVKGLDLQAFYFGHRDLISNENHNVIGLQTCILPQYWQMI